MENKQLASGIELFVENYELISSFGEPIRTATKVICSNGVEIKFIEKLSKKDAIKNAKYQLGEVLK